MTFPTKREGDGDEGRGLRGAIEAPGRMMDEKGRGLKIGVIGVKEGWSSRKLADAAARRTGRRRLIDFRDLTCDLSRRRILFEGENLAAFDGLIVKKLGLTYRPQLLDRLEILHFLHERGVRVFSKPMAMMRLINRLSCTVTLRAGGVPMPDTVVTENLDHAVEAVRRFERALLKPLYTSKARGMRVVDADDDPRRRVEAFRAEGNPVLYVQKAIPLPGHDFGVVFLGGEYLASYARRAQGDSSSRLAEKDKYLSLDPPDAVIDLARKAQALFDLDFTCVDVVESSDGPLVFEVSALGGFRGLLQARNLDAARLYVDYVIERLQR